MEAIKIEVSNEAIQNGIAKCIEEQLKSSYSNPVADAVKKALTEKEGVIKGLVDEIIGQAISDPEFKAKLADTVLARMVEMALKK